MKTILQSTALLVVTSLLVGTIFLRVAEGHQLGDTDTKQFNDPIYPGIELRRAHRYRELIASLDKTLAWARATGSVKLETESPGIPGTYVSRVAGPPTVLTLRLQALDIVRANPRAFDDVYQEFEALQGVAGSYFLLNDLPSAVRYARAAVELKAPHVDEMGAVGMGHVRQFLVSCSSIRQLGKFGESSANG